MVVSPSCSSTVPPVSPAAEPLPGLVHPPPPRSRARPVSGARNPRVLRRFDRKWRHIAGISGRMTVASPVTSNGQSAGIAGPDARVRCPGEWVPTGPLRWSAVAASRTPFPSNERERNGAPMNDPVTP